MAVTRIPTDVTIDGSLSVGGALAIPAGTVSDTHIASNAAIDVDKQEHLYKVGCDFGLEADATPGTSTTYTFTVFVASGAATVRAFKATMLDTGSQANTEDFDFDLQKAGVGVETLSTMLSADITIDSDIVDNTPVAATLSATSLVAGDMLVIEVVTPATITGAHGMFAWVELSEGAN